MRQKRLLIIEQLIARDGCKCHYCGKRLKKKNITIDHVVALALGGSEHITNLVLACGACNSRKGSAPGYQPRPDPLPPPAALPTHVLATAEVISNMLKKGYEVDTICERRHVKAVLVPLYQALWAAPPDEQYDFAVQNGLFKPA